MDIQVNKTEQQVAATPDITLSQPVASVPKVQVSDKSVPADANARVKIAVNNTDFFYSATSGLPSCRLT